MTVSIRLATLDDIPALQNLICESVRALGAKYYTAGQIESALRHVFGVDTQLIIDQTYFVAVDGDDVAASGGWSKRKTLFGGDQSKSMADPLLDKAMEAARIRAFYVHPRWSRKGIGSLILKACEDAARSEGFRRVELLSTLPGEPFYLARGYARQEAMPIETPDGESLPAFRMTKLL
jgi:GNAT superfamily N-acetyltransferase